MESILAKLRRWESTTTIHASTGPSARIAFVIVLLAVSGCNSEDINTQGNAGFTSSASIWLHPNPLPDKTDGSGGPAQASADFLDLIASTSEWPTVAAHTSAFGVYATWVIVTTDTAIAQLASFLAMRNMSIEIEAPALQATQACGTGVEGYVPYGQSLSTVTLTYLGRLKAAGINVQYIKIDESYFFGSVSGDPRACHWPVAIVASEVSQFVQLVHAVYPDAEVGDTEPVPFYTPNIVSQLSQWHDTYAAVSGRSFPFFVADMDWNNPSWPAIANSVAAEAHSRGMRFGIIYTGDPSDSSDDMWASKAISRFETYQGMTGGNPDFVLFQSWDPHPAYCLPETDPTTLTGVVRQYLYATGF
jgi:hypothetical protein